MKKIWIPVVGLIALVVVAVEVRFMQDAKPLVRSTVAPQVPSDWANPIRTTLDNCAIRTEVIISVWNLHVTDNSNLVVYSGAEINPNTRNPIYIQRLENNDCEIIVPKETVAAIQSIKLYRTSFPHNGWYYPVTKIEEK